MRRFRNRIWCDTISYNWSNVRYNQTYHRLKQHKHILLTQSPDMSLASERTKTPHCHVPLLAIGVNRSVASVTSDALKNLNRSNYPLVACLDMNESPKEYQFSAHNLGAVLHASYPRLKGLITGTAVSDEMLEQVRVVWEKYVADVINKEGLGGHCWVQVSWTMLSSFEKTLC